MKKLIISVVCLSLSTIALASAKVDAPQMAYIYNKSDTTVTVDYQLCQGLDFPKGDVCQPMTSVDIPSAKLSPGKNVAVIPHGDVYNQVSVVSAVEKASGKVVAQGQYLYSGSPKSICLEQAIALDDMNGTPYITCSLIKSAGQ